MISISGFSQEYIFGKVKSELGDELQNVIVLNLRTDEKSLTDKDGNYMIAAKNHDELRFVKSGFDRNSIKISYKNYSAPLDVSLLKSPYLIPEVELAFQATGNLKKDVKRLDPAKKVVALNSDMRFYMTTPLAEVAPKLQTPSAFATPNFNSGNLNISAIGGALLGLVQKAKNPPLTTANYAETQEFFRKIKNTMDLSFYTAQGWNEEDIDRFLIYADAFSSLAKKYRKNFDVSAISVELKLAYKEYSRTHKIGS